MTGAGGSTSQRSSSEGRSFVSVRLTPGAYAHGLAVALPEEVEVPVLPSRGRPQKKVVLERPTGFERATLMGALAEAIVRCGR